MIVLDTDNFRLGTTYNGRELVRFCKDLYVEYQEFTYAQIKTDWGRKRCMEDRRIPLKVSEGEFNQIVRHNVLKEAEITKPMHKTIKRQSEKRKKKNRIYSADRKVYLADHPQCQAKVSSDCTGESTEIHHKYSGSNRDKYFLDVTTWVAICRNCHLWVHANPKAARELRILC